MDELNKMHEQMKSLRETLNNSRLVNHEQLVSIMKHKASFLNIMVKGEFVVIAFMIIFLFRVCTHTSMSIWIAVSFTVLAPVDTIFDWINIHISDKDFARLDLVTLRRKIIRQKKNRLKQLIISGPLTLIWVAWFFYEIYTKLGKFGIPFIGDVNTAKGAVIVAVVTVIACVIIAVMIYRKIQSVSDSLIDTINEFTEK